MDERNGYNPGNETITNNNHDEPAQPANKRNNNKAVDYYGCHMRGTRHDRVRWIYDYGCCADNYLA